MIWGKFVLKLILKTLLTCNQFGEPIVKEKSMGKTMKFISHRIVLIQPFEQENENSIHFYGIETPINYINTERIHWIFFSHHFAFYFLHFDIYTFPRNCMRIQQLVWLLFQFTLSIFFAGKLNACFYIKTLKFSWYNSSRIQTLFPFFLASLKYHFTPNSGRDFNFPFFRVNFEWTATSECIV